MNRNLFYKINTVFGDKYLSDDYCNDLYEYYVYGSKVFGYEINVNSNDFNKFFSIVYDGISSKVSIDDFKKLSLQYVQLMMAEARVGKIVDINYFISSFTYFGFDSNLFKEFKKNIKEIIKSFKSEFISIKKK